jgi:thioredoxin
MTHQPGTVHVVTMENFESVVDGHALVLLDFWAGWCGPCKVFAPIFAAMAERHPDVFFGKVNTESPDAQELSQAFVVRSIPTLMAFKNADLVFEQPGVLPPAVLEDLIAKLR